MMLACSPVRDKQARAKTCGESTKKLSIDSIRYDRRRKSIRIHGKNCLHYKTLRI